MGINKEVEKINQKRANEEGVKDFFVKRDKGKRKTSGLVADVQNQVSESITRQEKEYEESLKIKKIENSMPLFSNVFLSARKRSLTVGGVYIPTAMGSSGDLSKDIDFDSKQIVLAKGPHANQIEVGMEVSVNFENFKTKVANSMADKVNGGEDYYDIPIEEIEGQKCIVVTERDLRYVSDTRNYFDK